MEVTSELICRAEGKVFEKLLISKESNHRIRLISNPDDPESSIPCQLFDAGTKEPGTVQYVAVYPILAISSGSLYLGEFDETGALISSHKHAVSYNAAKWKSRINYRLRSEQCFAVRRCEQGIPIADVQANFFQAISTPSHIILRAKLTLDGIDPNDLRITCVNSALNAVSASFVKLDLEQGAGEYPASSATISISIPWNQGDLYFEFSSQSPDASVSVVPLRAEVYQALIQESDKILYNDAGRDPYYQEWFETHRVSDGDLSKQRVLASSMATTFSIIVPLFNTPEDYFLDMLNSVIRQSYPKWELILVNASPDSFELEGLVTSACSGDSRICSVNLKENYGITRNTAYGISAATGDYICFFDHDDTLEPDILFEYAQAISNNSEIDVLYCDEDKLMPDGSYATPFFKPDYNIDLLRSNNYICHMLCLKSSLLGKLIFDDCRFDGAQDHNLILQASELTSAIYHVPRVLYHWRISSNSTASDQETKPYAAIAGQLAVQSHLDRLDIPAFVSRSVNKSFSYDVIYEPPSDNPLVSIVIPTKDRVGLLRNCIDSIVEKTEYHNYEILLVDNQSHEETTFQFYADLKQFCPKTIRIVKWDNEFNFSSIMNFGRKHARGSYLLFLNNDTEVISPNWIDIMLGICSRKDVGVVGAKLYFPDDTIQHAGVILARNGAVHMFNNLPREQFGYFNLADSQRDCSAVTAACMMTPIEVFDRIGGFDEELRIAYNDVDYCLKARELGYLTVFTPFAELYHFESVTRALSDQDKALVKFVKETGILFQRYPEYFAFFDPYGSPNVSRDSDACAHYRF